DWNPGRIRTRARQKACSWHFYLASFVSLNGPRDLPHNTKLETVREEIQNSPGLFRNSGVASTRGRARLRGPEFLGQAPIAVLMAKRWLNLPTGRLQRALESRNANERGFW